MSIQARINERKNPAGPIMIAKIKVFFTVVVNTLSLTNILAKFLNPIKSGDDIISKLQKP